MAENTGAKSRQPIVVVMGHVDHGKTTLLDYIRKTALATREAGGITQAIGAYEAEHNDRKITFIDTPGHEAFSKMRARGASAADMAVLVVAAEEGVKPQTKEVIKTLEETKTPFVVAINKIDKPGVDIEKTKNDLMAAGVYLEGYGGQVSYEPISAKTGENVDKLLDLILLAADMAELGADASKPGTGYVLETRLNKNRGLEVSIISKDGIFSRGDDVATSTAKGKIKMLENFLGKPVESVLPGVPALIVGFEESPVVGEEIFSGAEADENYKKTAGAKRDLSPTTKDGEISIPLILKASDAGSLEALSEIVRAMPLPKPVKIVDESVGEIGESDIKMAISSGADIVAFKTKLDRAAKNLTEARDVKIMSSDIIYELIKAIEDSARHLAEGKLIGELDVLAVFNQTKLEKQVVGGRVVSGIFKNKGPFEITRGGEKVGLGKITNLQSQKKDIISLPDGQEGGLMVGSDVAIQKGDHLLIRDKREEKI